MSSRRAAVRRLFAVVFCCAVLLCAVPETACAGDWGMIFGLGGYGCWGGGCCYSSGYSYSSGYCAGNGGFYSGYYSAAPYWNGYGGYPYYYGYNSYYPNYRSWGGGAYPYYSKNPYYYGSPLPIQTHISRPGYRDGGCGRRGYYTSTPGYYPRGGGYVGPTSRPSTSRPGVPMPGCRFIGNPGQ